MRNKMPSYYQMTRPIEKLFKGSQSQFEQLIRNSFDTIVLLDSEGIQRYVSPSCEHILGYKPEELMDIPVIEQLIHPEDQKKTRAGLKDIVENQTNGGTQYRHRHKDGGWVYLEAFGTNQLNNPDIQSVVLNVRDITERKKAEEALRESEARLSELNATKDRIFSVIGHDLRSPFNSIIGFSQLLAKQVKKKDYEGLEKYARIIHDSSQKAMDLLANLLEWSRSQSGNIEFNPKYFELTHIIQEAVELSKNAARQKSITLTQDLPHNLKVFADKAMINTILRNLISNGIKFTPPGGEISISTGKSTHHLVVSVADNGIGIKKEDLDKLFRIDVAHSTSGTQKESGTGLGLLLCKEFAEMNGGRIWAESTPGKGSTFSFTIPTINKV
ncbi:MAG: PAS domain-containing sensor histidine kinase [Bacteroidales bacterium]|nr:PAS domain-containing sensor histidine kinase [Bacteroidales bacterium]